MSKTDPELRKRVTFATNPTIINEEVVCMIKEPETPTDLFLKSMKFFTFVFVVAGLTSLLMEMFTGTNKIYLYFAIGLFVSMLASYFKLRIWMNPEYQPPCDCANPETFIPSKEDMVNGVFTVLGHKKSALLFGIPNTVYGMFFYSFMILINACQIPYVNLITFLFTVVSCSGSVYLWYTMICEIGSVCAICSSIHAISFLTLFSFLF